MRSACTINMGPPKCLWGGLTVTMGPLPQARMCQGVYRPYCKRVKKAFIVLLWIQQEYFFFQPKLLREILNCFPIHLSHEVPLFLTQDESDLSKSSLYPLSAWLRARCQVWSKDYFFAQRLQHSIWGRIALLDCKAQTRKAQNFVMGVFLWLVRNAASTRSTD